MSNTDTAVKEKTLSFGADVPKLMDIVTNALYTDKDIVIRELLSNASDALEKLRYGLISGQYKDEEDMPLQVMVHIDPKARTITFSDAGIGMDEKDLQENLGTIARSGTKNFLQAMEGAKDPQASTNMIGQFGVGFYSAFVVADRVTVHTRKVASKKGQGFLWSSDAKSGYSIEPLPRSERGTTITLHLKSDENKFLDIWQVEQVIKKYSDFLPFDILLSAEADKSQAPSSEEAADDDASEATDEPRVINHGKAIWLRAKKDVKKEEYIEFYKHLKGSGDPLAWVHNHVDGAKLSYKTLMYIPEQAPFDLWMREQKRGLKLYVNRVFIMDHVEQFLPMYLRFVSGVVDCSDLQLNVSRELLQKNPAIETIRQGCTKRILSMLTTMAEKDSERYQRFWSIFGQVLKEGIGEDFANKEILSKLCRFATTASDTADQHVSLADYVGRMKDNQKHIYYITADSYSSAKQSPHLEIFKKHDIEVLLLHDRVDEWFASHCREFEGKSLKSVAKGALDDIDAAQDDDDKAKQEEKRSKKQKTMEPLVKRIEKVEVIRMRKRQNDVYSTRIEAKRRDESKS